MIAHGLAGTTLAGATAVAADHSIAVAVITAASGLGVVVAAQIGAAIRETARRKAIDHDAEHRSELLDIAEHFRQELVEADSRNLDAENRAVAAEKEAARLRRENVRLRRERRG